jgi:hypothetical protein
MGRDLDDFDKVRGLRARCTTDTVGRAVNSRALPLRFHCMRTLSCRVVNVGGLKRTRSDKSLL